MKKDATFHYKRATIATIVALVFLTLATLPVFLGLTKEVSGYWFDHKHIVTAIQMTFAFLGIAGYVFSVYHQNKYSDLKRLEREDKRLERYNAIKQLIRDGKTEEGLDELDKFYAKYF